MFIQKLLSYNKGNNIQRGNLLASVLPVLPYSAVQKMGIQGVRTPSLNPSQHVSHVCHLYVIK